MVCLERFVWAAYLDKGPEQVTMHHFCFAGAKQKVTIDLFNTHLDYYVFIIFHEIDECQNQTYPLWDLQRVRNNPWNFSGGFQKMIQLLDWEKPNYFQNQNKNAVYTPRQMNRWFT